MELVRTMRDRESSNEAIAEILLHRRGTRLAEKTNIDLRFGETGLLESISKKEPQQNL